MARAKAQLKKLLALPTIEQKTEEWYEMRRNMITASDFAQALGEGKFGSQKELIQKKCTPRENETAISLSNPFFKWGHMFEPVACAVYSKMKGVKIHEFGLIRHPKYSFFGASPDGISEEGIMLEIKCPLKRKLVQGEVPKQYYYQIQGQLDVCGLDLCDYFECTFEIVKDYGEWRDGHRGKIRGVFRELPDGSYEYQEPFLEDECISEKAWLGPGCNYWYLKEWNLVRVERDESFFATKIKELEKVWRRIEYYRDNKSAFEIEILNSITIETEGMGAPQKAPVTLKTLLDTKEYMFLD